MDLTGNAAVVTGASSGIGEATARTLAAEGVRVALAARRAGDLDALAADIEDAGGDAVAIPTDVTDREAVVAMVDTAVEAFGRLDVLVNSAGVGHWEPAGVVEGDPDRWRDEVEVNLLGTMYATHAAVQQMASRESGAIVNVSSLAGQFPAPEAPGYATSKWAVRGFTQSLVPALREHGIRVTIVEPGEVHTPMQPDPDGYGFRILDPEDVADAVRYAITRPDHVTVSEVEVRPSHRS